MKAAYLVSKALPATLIFGDVPKPTPRAGEVLVRVHATAITPTEISWAPTFTDRSGMPRMFPVVLGHEFSGVVAETGPDVDQVEVGDAVFGLNDWFVNGAEAEYCVVLASSLAKKPGSLDHAHAAAVPISALTAWQALVVRSRLAGGTTVLIHGGAGAVGIFAVQIARERGARVIATASAVNKGFVHDLGADEVIDYRATHFEDVVRNVDVVLDTIGGDTLQRSWSVLRPGGTLITIAAESESLKEQRVRDSFMLVAADGSRLATIGEMIDTGRLRVFVAAEFPLAKANAAYTSANRRGGHGKTVLRVLS